MLKSLSFLTVILFSLTLFISCENSTEPEDGPQVLKMTAIGVDWSEGIAATADGSVRVDNSDGETVAWCPNGEGGRYGNGIWYRSGKNHIYKWGTGDITEVVAVDTTLWDPNICDSPLKNGDIWVAEAEDGYVAFQVLNVATDSLTIVNDPMYPVEVEYVFSTTLGF